MTDIVCMHQGVTGGEDVLLVNIIRPLLPSGGGKMKCIHAVNALHHTARCLLRSEDEHLPLLQGDGSPLVVPSKWQEAEK